MFEWPIGREHDPVCADHQHRVDQRLSAEIAGRGEIKVGSKIFRDRLLREMSRMPVICRAAAIVDAPHAKGQAHGDSNISPVEVERVLNKHPAVRDAAVFGVPDAVLGERVASLVQLAENARPTARDEILASVKAVLADYKVPEWLEIVSEIPRNGLGKIDRKLLRATVAFRGEAIATPNSSLHPRTG